MTYHYLAKLTLLFLIFFSVFYFETIEFSGIKFAVIWKTVLLLLLLVIIFFRSARYGMRLPKLTFWGVLFTIQSMFNASLPSNIFDNLSESVKHLYISVFYSTYSFKKEYSFHETDRTYRLILLLSAYITLSVTPFLTGFLEPIAQGGYDLSLFGIDGKGFVGIFQNAHAASITLGTAMIVLIFEYYRQDSIKTKIALLLLLTLAFFALYQTYARTGYFLFALGLFTFFAISKEIRFKLLKFTLIFSLLFIAVYLLYQFSEVFRMRLIGENIYTAQSGTADIGSGRLGFIAATYHYFFSQDFATLFLGLGPENAKELMLQHVGLHISSHNGFVNILQYNGIFGLSLYLVFIFYICAAVYSSRRSDYFPLIASLFIAYLAQMLVQGERVFLADVIFAISLALGTSCKTDKAINNRSV